MKKEIEILVDADACPVKSEIYKVAKRYSIHVTLVANMPLAVPESKKSWVKMTVVQGNLDAAGEWIAENVGPDAIVVTDDIPLAARSAEKGASVITTKGIELSEERIVEALADRDLQAELRKLGLPTKGVKPFESKDRSQFLQSLDRTIQIMNRQRDEG